MRRNDWVWAAMYSGGRARDPCGSFGRWLAFPGRCGDVDVGMGVMLRGNWYGHLRPPVACFLDKIEHLEE